MAGDPGAGARPQAEKLRCGIQLSETLNILEHSLRNLQRAGFREVYEKEVFAWNDPDCGNSGEGAAE